MLPVAIGAPSVTLAADGSALPPVSSVQQIAIDAPWQKLALTAERTWTVHQLADIAFTATLVDLGAFNATTVYREGNIVQQQGVSWLRGSAAASSDAPPTLPTTSNTWWTQLGGGGVQTFSGAATPSTPHVQDLWAPGDGNFYRYTDGPGGPLWVKISDITITAVPAVSLATDRTIAADYQGNVTGDFPTFVPTVLRNSLSIKASGSVTYAVVKPSDGTAGADGGTVSLDSTSGAATKGNVTPTAFASGSNQIRWRYQVTIDGVIVYSEICTLSKLNSAPPSGGGGGGGGAPSKNGTAPANAGTSSASFVPASNAAAIALILAMGDRLYASLSCTYLLGGPAAGSGTSTLKHQYSTSASGPWTDFAAAVTGSYSTKDGDGNASPGSVTVNQIASGLSAGTYYVQTVFTSDGGRRITLDGSVITYEAKP